MNKQVIIRAAITWFIFIPVAILNGTFRQFFLLPHLGDTSARQISTLMLSIIYVLISYLLMRNQIANLNPNKLLMIGFAWLILTLIFEFGLGILGGKTWEYMLSDYKLSEGRIWPLFLLTVLITPYLVKLIKVGTLTRN